MRFWICAGVAVATASFAACSSSSNDVASSSDAGAEGGAHHVDAGMPVALDPKYFDSCASDLSGDPIFTLQNPDPSVVDISALDSLLAESATQKSNGVLIAVGDTIIADKCFSDVSAPASVQSITKTIVSLEIGALISDGKIPSIDTLVSTFYPEWTGDSRAQVTIRHLLTQTSGIDDVVDPDGGVPELFEAPDELAYARTQVPSTTPGTEFSYSNTGVMLFAGIIKQAAGMDAQAFADQRFFAPLGITDDQWDRDTAGNVMTAGGLFLTPIDLLRIARLARENGTWQGSQILPATWLQLTTAPQTVVDFPCYGYLWWMVRGGCSPDNGLVGTAGKLQGFYADGYGGNVAVVIPQAHIVGVRTNTPPLTQAGAIATDFDAFPLDLAAIAK